MERRRLRAVREMRFHKVDEKLAKKHGVVVKTLWRWKAKEREEGIDSLLRRPTPGRPSRLKDEQILAVYEKGSKSYNKNASQWTGPLLAEAIFQECEVHYSTNWAQQLLRKFEAQGR
jgi:transposase